MLTVNPHNPWQMHMRNEQKLEISVIQYANKICMWLFLAESVHFFTDPNSNGNFMKLQLCESILYVMYDFNSGQNYFREVISVAPCPILDMALSKILEK